MKNLERNTFRLTKRIVVPRHDYSEFGFCVSFRPLTFCDIRAKDQAPRNRKLFLQRSIKTRFIIDEVRKLHSKPPDSYAMKADSIECGMIDETGQF